jgi:intein/homing endonuclease
MSVIEKIPTRSLLNITERYYAEYGKHTIEQRALVDYRDGLKPVSRRTVWAMGPVCGNLNLKPGGAFKKCARVVGDAMGKYHPHGDTSIYEALVTQAAKVPVPLIQGEGNFGGPTDNAAAMRYCFSAETLVSTEYGLIPIADVPRVLRLNDIDSSQLSIKMKVESNDKPLLATSWIKSGIRRLYTVRTPFSSVRATNNEPFLILDENLNIDWKKLSDLKEGDLVCYHRNPKIKWSTGGIRLKTCSVSSNKNEKQVEFPKVMSKDLAEWLGLIISEGHIQNHCLGFTNTDRNIVAKFVKLTKRLFKNANPIINWREPDGWAKQMYCQVYINSNHLCRWLKENDVPSGTAGNKYIPECVLRGNKEEVVAFLSHLFEGDGSNANNIIFYTSKSTRLLSQLQVLMITRFGLPFRYAPDGKLHRIYMSGKGFYEKFLKEIGFVSTRKSSMSTISARYNNSTINFLEKIPAFIKEAGLSGRKDHSLTNEHGDKIGRFSSAALAISNPPLRWHDLCEWFAESGDVLKANYPSVYNKVKSIIEADFFFAPIKSITKSLKEMTYDLSVPGSHAYTANGMIVHNTECRVSKYGWETMFSPDYLATVMDNLAESYDGSEREPFYLPATLPNVLINGTYGIATGLTGVIPPIHLETLIPFIERHIAGKTISDKTLKRDIRFNHVYGGDNDSTDEQMDQFLSEGYGSLRFGPKYSIDYDTRVMLVTEIPPMCNWDTVVKRLGSQKKIAPFLSSYEDTVSKADRKKKGSRAVRFMIKFKTSVDRDNIKELAALVGNAFITKSYASAVRWTTRNSADSVDLTSGTLSNLICLWTDYRIKLEVDARRGVIKDIDHNLMRQSVFQLASDNLEVLAKIIKNSKTPVEDMIKRFPVLDKDKAQIILDMTLRRLARINRSAIEEETLRLQKARKVAVNYKNNPGPKVLSDLNEALKIAVPKKV